MVTSTTSREILHSSITPSGIEVAYGTEPKRFYLVDGQEVPSVTQVLNTLDKSGPLIWWGQGVAVDGVVELFRRGRLHLVGNEVCLWDGWNWVLPQEKALVSLLVEEKLSTNHVRDHAANRGLAVHDAFETWATTGTRPDPSIFPDEERGYVLGLLAFLDDVNPEPLAAEVMVGSVEHGYAGRYDIRLRVPAECQVVFHRTPKRGPRYATLKPGVLLGDLKTSKDVYVTHSLQLEAYEAASIECGYEPTEARGILNVTADGHYKFVRSRATADDFLCVLAVYRMLERLNDASKTRKKVLANLAKPIQERGDEVLLRLEQLKREGK